MIRKTEFFTDRWRNLAHFFLLVYFTGGKTPDVSSRTYSQIMREHMLQGEETEVSYYILLMPFRVTGKFRITETNEFSHLFLFL